MIDLGQANATASAAMIYDYPSHRVAGWPEAARAAGLDPSGLKAVWSHCNGGKIPENAVASFFVRRRDPRWYLVAK